MAATADRFDCIAETGSLKNARRLMRAVCRPLHRSQRKRQLVCVGNHLCLAVQNGPRQFARRVLAQPLGWCGNSHTRPAGSGQNGPCNVIFVDSHNDTIGTDRERARNHNPSPFIAIDTRRPASIIGGMCNLYRMRGTAAEVGRLFNVQPQGGANYGEEVYPGYPGLVVAEGSARAMTWGFPLALTGKQGQRLKPKPVNNAREDKLHTPFWRDSFAKRRCLIPVSQWGEAEGEKGRMTRTWYGIPNEPIFAVAGLWRATLEWGDAYSMVMVDGCDQMADAHDRMPVVLARDDWQTWLNGAPADAFALCQTCSCELVIDKTSEPWAAPRTARAQPLL